MKVFFIGFGQAGGKVVDLFVGDDLKRETHHFRAIAVNTARTDLMGLSHIAMKNRVLIGQTVVKGHGVGTDNETGARITAEEIDSIMSAIDNVGTHEIEAFVVIAGLGGGTGSGGTPVLVKHLKETYKEPVYVLGIVPAPEEGRLYSYNAARSLATIVKEADNTFLFDNSAWKAEGESIHAAFQRLNLELVRRFNILFRSGEGRGRGVGEMVVDSSEIINTLKSGGISSVGYAKSELPQEDKGVFGNIFDRFSQKKENDDDHLVGEDRSARIISLVRRAVLGRLTLPCDITTPERALVLIAGPPAELDRKGIEKAKSWISETINGVEVRGGDYPVQSRFIAAVVLLASVRNAPRIDELIAIAKEIKELKEKRKEEVGMFLSDDVEPLF